MPTTTRTYWNPLSSEHRGFWQPIEGLEGMAEEFTLAIDEASGDYTRLWERHSGSSPAVMHPRVRRHEDWPT